MFQLLGKVLLDFEFQMQLGGVLQDVHVWTREDHVSVVVRVPGACAGHAIKATFRMPEPDVRYQVTPRAGGRRIGQDESESESFFQSPLLEFNCYQDGSPILLGEEGSRLEANFNFQDLDREECRLSLWVCFEVGDVNPSRLNDPKADFKPAFEPSRSRRPALRKPGK